MTSQRMAWIGAGVEFLLSCGWKFTLGLEHVLDLRLSDETKYLSYALGYDAPDNPAQWSPLYVPLYRLEHVFIGDPIDLYFFHLKLVAILLPLGLFIYLASRRAPFVIALIGAGYFMISAANLPVETKTMHVALAGMFLCLALFVGLGQHPARWGLTPAAAALLSFKRPEFATAFLGFAIYVAYLVIATRNRKLHTLLPILDACHERLNGPVFPRAYFAWCAQDENNAALATAYVQGTTLRSRLLMLAAFRQTSRLLPIFRSSGAKMRRFHDAFGSTDSIGVAPLIDSTTELVQQTTYFSAAEKASVRAHLDRYAHFLAVRTLPTVQVHNDWILRNIMVTADGTDYVVDCDSMRSGTDLRWFDMAYFLLNMDSQLKWHPLVTAERLVELSREFWYGYADEHLPDSLTREQVIAILYILRLRCLLGGTTRPPYFQVMGGSFDRRVLRRLEESVVSGEATLFDLRQNDVTESRRFAAAR
jgi:hypothetical protein